MDEGPREVGEKKYKKKKKQSLVQKTKKYGKKGQFGRGKQIEKVGTQFIQGSSEGNSCTLCL